MCLFYRKHLILTLVQRPRELFWKFYLVVPIPLPVHVMVSCSSVLGLRKHEVWDGADDSKSALSWALRITKCFPTHRSVGPHNKPLGAV